MRWRRRSGGTETLYARVPMERVGVLIGTEGETKARVEEASGVPLEVDSKTGEVTIKEVEASDPSQALKVRDLVTAIGRGFSEEKALRLLEDDVYLRIFDIKEYASGPSRMAQLKGRVIGKKGKTRGLIEELTGAMVSVYGHTVALIGTALPLEVASRAVEMLLRGSQHAAVYRYLESQRPALRMDEMGF